MPVLESSIQRAVVKHARQRKAIAIKLSTLARFGTSGWPDYVFFAPVGRVFFIEFKAPGKDATPRQKAKMKDLADLGFHVYLVDETEEGKRVIDKELWL